MDYRKLTLSITLGILLAVGIIAAGIEGPQAYREYELRKRLTAIDLLEHQAECRNPSSCMPEKYAEYLALVGKRLASLEQASRAYCEATTPPMPSRERTRQLVAGCETETQRRMTADVNK